MLIVGLGNPGKKYAETRHNLGFMVMDALAEASSESWSEKGKLKADVIETQITGNKVVLAKPTTFMNLSGEAVQALKQQYKTKEIIVVYDDVSMDFGKVRIRKGGSSGGHNGIKSITKHIGEDYWRVKIGVGAAPEKIPLEKWVLGKLTKEEAERLPAIIASVVDRLLSGAIESTTE